MLHWKKVVSALLVFMLSSPDLVKANWSVTYEWDAPENGTVLGWRASNPGEVQISNWEGFLRASYHNEGTGNADVDFFLAWVHNLNPGDEVTLIGKIAQHPGTTWCPQFKGYWNSSNDLFSEEGEAGGTPTNWDCGDNTSEVFVHTWGVAEGHTGLTISASKAYYWNQEIGIMVWYVILILPDNAFVTFPVGDAVSAESGSMGAIKSLYR